MNYKQYENQVKYYKGISEKVSYLIYLIAIIGVLFYINRIYSGNFLTRSQPFWFLLSLISSCIALIRRWQYKHLLSDRVSQLYEGETVYTLGEPKTFTERIIKNRQVVYSDAVFFWLGIVFFTIAAFIWLLPPEDKNKISTRQAYPKDDGKLNLTLVQVNDVYEIAPLDNGSVGGMARIASLKKHCQEKNKNTLLVMAGDFLSSSVYNGIKKDGAPVAGMQMIEAMNTAGFDLAVFGNHEFDINEQQLQHCIDESAFDWVSSTAFKKGRRHTPFKKKGRHIPETWIKAFRDEDGTTAKIGFIGITLDDNKAAYVDYDTNFETINKLYDQLKLSCDAVIALTHQNMNDDIRLAEKLPGLAAIIGGHEHDFQFKKVGNVFISKAHSNAKSAFVLDFVFDKQNKQTKVMYTLKYMDDSIKPDGLTDAVVQKWSSFALDYFRSTGFAPNAVIYRGEAFDGRDTEVRRDRSNKLAGVIIKAMEAACPDAKMAVFNAGAIRVDDMLPTQVTQYDVLRTLPYPGTIQEMNIRGDTLIQMLTIGLSNINEGSFLQYSGSVQLKAGKWYIGISPIDASTHYRIAIAPYLASGCGKNLEFLKSIKLIGSGMFAPGDVRSDVRLAVIKQLHTMSSQKNKYGKRI